MNNKFEMSFEYELVLTEPTILDLINYLSQSLFSTPPVPLIKTISK